MNKENHFCTFSQSVSLKRLGLDINDCVGTFIDNENNVYKYRTFEKSEPDLIRSPLRSQVLEFFREQHNLFCDIVLDQTSNVKFGFYIHKYNGLMDFTREDYNIEGEWSLYRTYSECELACIDKLIQIVLNQNE